MYRIHNDIYNNDTQYALNITDFFKITVPYCLTFKRAFNSVIFEAPAFHL